jgi:hypothetical protein
VEKNYYTVSTGQVETKSFTPNHYNNNMGASSTPTIPNPNPQGAALSTKMYKLNSSTQKTGLGITLKVMAGDNVNVYGRSQFTSTTSSVTNSNNTVLNLLTGFLTTPAALGTEKGITGTNINTSINSTALNTLISSQANGTGTNPKAGLCCLPRRKKNYCAGGGFCLMKDSTM